MNNFYKNFCSEEYDAKGVLTSFTPIYNDNFNFAYDVVDEIALREPNRRAVIWCDDNDKEKHLTFSDIKVMSDKTAQLLREKGIKKGDKVMLILRRHIEFWFCITALHKLGAVVIPATDQLTKKDILYRLNAAGVDGLICTAVGDVTKNVDDALNEYPSLKFKMVTGNVCGWDNFNTELSKVFTPFVKEETKALDPMLLYFTSGTTGHPKMVMHDYTYPIGHIITAKHWHNIHSDSIHLTVSDTGWGKAVWGKYYGQWMMGACVFIYDFEKFNPTKLLEHIETYKITSFCAPPTIYRFFIKEGIEGHDLSSLEYATTAGEALNPEVYNKFLDYTGLKLMEGFGQTESTLLTVNLVGTNPRVGSMGKASPLYNVDIIDEDGESAQTGAVGEIVVRLSNEKQVGLFMGYYMDEQRTAQSKLGGVYHTGDTAWRDEEGFFWYVGRTDDVIKASGYRIGPFEIESVLMEHPAVMECAVAGAPDPVRGTVVKAFIILTKEYTPSEELTRELQNYVKKQTAPYKYPRIVEYMTELPKTISGKIKRNELRNLSK